MKLKLFSILAIFFMVLLAFPQDSFSRGGGRGGSHGASSKGGSSYKGGSGKSYKGGTHKSGISKSSNLGTPAGQRKSNSSVTSSHPLKIDPSVKRDSKGRIVRSEAAKEAFLKTHGLKSVPKGYQVDHKIPLYAGGKDDPSNMQLLTKEQHRIKTKEDYQKYGR